MTRDPRLHGLSSDHHHALVLALSVARLVTAGTADGRFARDVGERFAREIEPHFAVEEEVLLPALRQAGARDLVGRTEADHAELRGMAARARAGEVQALAPLAERLRAHVRFEEHELFPACEARLAGGVLDEVARRAPGPRKER